MKEAKHLACLGFWYAFLTKLNHFWLLIKLRDVQFFFLLEPLEAVVYYYYNTRLNLNAVVLLGSPRWGREVENRPAVEQSEYTQHLCITFTILYGHCDTPNNYNENIKDHSSQVTITNVIKMGGKNWNIAGIAKIWHSPKK